MTKLYKKNNKVEYKYLEEETFILLIEKESGHFYKLDEVGTNVWKLLNGRRSVDKIVDVLLKEYDVTKTILKKDVTNFITKGLKIKIISSNNPTKN